MQQPSILTLNGIVVSYDATIIDRTCGRCVVFSRRHVGSRNMTVVDTYPGGYVQVSARIAAERESDAMRLDAARRETARLESVRARRFAKVQQVETAKRDGGRRADPKDSDARNRRQLAKMTGLDRGVTRAYAQLDGRLAAARRREAGLTVAAKRYDGDIWMDIEPSRRRKRRWRVCCVIIRARWSSCPTTNGSSGKRAVWRPDNAATAGSDASHRALTGAMTR